MSRVGTTREYPDTFVHNCHESIDIYLMYYNTNTTVVPVLALLSSAHSGATAVHTAHTTRGTMTVK